MQETEDVEKHEMSNKFKKSNRISSAIELKNAWMHRDSLIESQAISNEPLSRDDQKEAIKNIFIDALNNSFGQAIIKIILTPFLIPKLFLILLVLGSSGIASFLVIQSIMTYLTYGVSTSSRTVYETPSLFPKVTFCNVNPFATKYAFNLTQYKIENGDSLFNDEQINLGHDLKDILIECQFNLSPCNFTDFTWSFDPDYGNCYTFNSGFDSNQTKIDLRQSTIADPTFGLQLTLYVNIYEELLDLKEFTNGIGVLVRIDNSSYTRYFSSSGIFVAPGTNTFIELNREFILMLPKPYSNCEIDWYSPTFMSNSDLYNLIAESQFAYTQQLCFIQCIQKHSIEKNNCSLPFLVTLYNQTTCNWNLSGLMAHLNNVFDNNFINEKCLPSCPLECNQTLYKTSISSCQLIGNQYKSYILNNSNLLSDYINRTIDANTARESFVKVNLFYSSLSYTSTNETPQMDLVSLLASIGGSLGLFLGVSVFSLCEIVEVMIEIIYILNEKKKLKPTA